MVFPSASRRLTTACTRPPTRWLSSTCKRSGRRVMRGVRALWSFKSKTEACGYRTARGSFSNQALLFEEWGRASGYPVRGVAGGSRLRVRWVDDRCVAPSHTPPNKPMHPTADTHLVINLRRAGRRVIGGVRRLLGCI